MKFLNIKKTLAGMLDDTSYIQEIRHFSGMVGSVVWQQYDVLLAVRPYGWDTMVD